MEIGFNGHNRNKGSIMNKTNLKSLVDRLDGHKIGKIGINKMTTMDGDKEHAWLTLYSTDNRGDEYDEQLTFGPEELVLFCHEIIRIEESQNYNKKCTKRFSLCLDCDDKNKCKRYSKHRNSK